MANKRDNFSSKFNRSRIANRPSQFFSLPMPPKKRKAASLEQPDASATSANAVESTRPANAITDKHRERLEKLQRLRERMVPALLAPLTPSTTAKRQIAMNYSPNTTVKPRTRTTT
jgi:hypothetical protein